MRIRQVLRSAEGQIHVDKGDSYDTYKRVTKRYDPISYRNNLVVRVTSAGDDRNGYRETLTLQDAVREIENATADRYYAKSWGAEEFRF